MPRPFVPTGRFRSALALLLDAFDSAQDTQAQSWEFAVDLNSLLGAGFTVTNLRWLIRKGYAEHAFEYTLAGDEQREFRIRKTHVFLANSNFVLSDAGARFARPICRKQSAPAVEHGNPKVGPQRPSSTNTQPEPSGDAARQEATASDHELPSWDSKSLELSFREEIVLKFARSAPNEEPLLDEFERMNWEPRINVPAFYLQGSNRKAHLRNAIKELNRKQRRKRLHFSSELAGTFVCWKPIERPPRRTEK